MLGIALGCLVAMEDSTETSYEIETKIADLIVSGDETNLVRLGLE